MFDSSVSLPLLPISSTSHLLFYLVTLPISLLLGLLNRIISVRHFLFAQPFVLFEFISQSDSHSSIFPSLALFFLPFLYLFPSWFVSLSTTISSPPLPVLVSLGSVVIKSDSSLAENNKQSLLKSEIAV